MLGQWQLKQATPPPSNGKDGRILCVEFITGGRHSRGLQALSFIP